MSNIIAIKHGTKKPTTENLSNFELGFCTGDGRLYINNNGKIVSPKSDTVFPGEVIPSGADLNTYTTPGTYRSQSAAISATLLNTPYTVTGFKLEVFNTNSSNVFMQEIKCNSASARTYRRTGDKSSGVVEYGDWYKVMQSATDTLSVIDGGTGATSFTSGQVLVGNGTGAITQKAIDTTAKSGSANLITSGAVYTELTKKSDTSHKHAAGDITSGKLSVARGGTNGTNAFEATNNLLALYLGNLTNTANDLAENSNLDNITAGVYRSGTKEISATITNAPTTAAGFRLIASYLTTSSSFVQIAISYSTSVNIWVRIKTTSWGDWKKLTFA